MDNSANFSKFNVNTPHETKQLLLKYQDLFKWHENEDIIEIGCADGRITRNILYPFVDEHLHHLIGSDISQEAIDVANQFNANPKLTFEKIDITDENFTKKYQENIDHIFSFFSFHSIPSPQRWSKNVFNMLKSNRQFFFTMLMYPHPYTVIVKAQKADKTAPWYKYIENVPDLFVDYGPEPMVTIKKLLIEAGFTTNVMEIVTIKSTYPTLETFNGMMLSANSYLKYIPGDLLTSYTEDFLRRNAEQIQKAEDGSYFYYKNVLTVLATKP